MTRHGSLHDIVESDLDLTEPKDHAAGVPAVLVSLKHARERMGVARTAATLPRPNQRHGFDCPGSARPETPDHRKPAEFCENGTTPDHAVFDTSGRTSKEAAFLYHLPIRSYGTDNMPAKPDTAVSEAVVVRLEPAGTD